MEHSGAIAALLWLPVVIVGFLMVADAARRDLRVAAYFMRRFDSTGSVIKSAALLMMISATVHLGLAPAHASAEPLTALLFVLDALGLTGLSLLVFVDRRWQLLSVVALTMGIGAYFAYLVAGLETPDAVAVMTKLVEVAAIALLLIRSRVPFVSPVATESANRSRMQIQKRR